MAGLSRELLAHKASFVLPVDTLCVELQAIADAYSDAGGSVRRLTPWSSEGKTLFVRQGGGFLRQNTYGILVLFVGDQGAEMRVLIFVRVIIAC